MQFGEAYPLFVLFSLIFCFTLTYRAAWRFLFPMISARGHDGGATLLLSIGFDHSQNGILEPPMPRLFP